MKKKLYSVVIVAVIALAAGLYVSESKSDSSVTDLVTSNVNAFGMGADACYLNYVNWWCGFTGLTGCSCGLNYEPL
ncbi:MAG: hypothetical protein LBS88_08630 [Tannerellaceae bacterium]|jgi:hypothetical protein|nr:hypothetical protein [Tannerellaceae bacterium]